MQVKIMLGATAAVAATWLLTPTDTVSAGDPPIPDLICGRLRNDGFAWGTVNGISAYSIGTTACNNGSTLLSWRDSGADANQHPVIAQNLYRILDGRFEQIGMSWVKHGHTAADDTACGTCQQTNDPHWLGLGCSDTYVSFINGSQSRLGPRSAVNPATGFFTMPHGAPTGNNTLRGRVQVDIDDMNPALNPGATYLGEGHYITPDDAGTITGDNNVTWREGVIGDLIGGVWELTFVDEHHAEEPAIAAWATLDPLVELTVADVPGDGRFILGHRVADNGDGTWRYDYALYNMNAHRAARSFTIPIPADVTVGDVRFHDVDTHSGEPYDTTDWAATITGTGITWETAEADVDPAANALRWGTVYSFGFVADESPTAATAAVDLFLAGGAAGVEIAARGPRPGTATPCPADVDDSGTVNIDDLIRVLEAWMTDDPAADLDGSGFVDVLDIVAVILGWGPC